MKDDELSGYPYSTSRDPSIQIIPTNIAYLGLFGSPNYPFLEIPSFMSRISYVED